MSTESSTKSEAPDRASPITESERPDDLIEEICTEEPAEALAERYGAERRVIAHLLRRREVLQARRADLIQRRKVIAGPWDAVRSLDRAIARVDQALRRLGVEIISTDGGQTDA